MTIQVILADDQPLVRAGLRRLIEQTPDIDVAGEAGTGAEAVQLARDAGPDVVVMDIRMPGMDGIEATRLITAGDAPARVLVLTTFDDDDYVYGALRAGASGFLVKDMALEDILTAIRVVAAGDAMIAPGVTRRLIGQFAGQPRSGRKPRELTGITDREREVLRLVGLGMSNAEIAAALYITAGTVKTHVARLLAKLGARDRVQLVITAYPQACSTPPPARTTSAHHQAGYLLLADQVGELGLAGGGRREGERGQDGLLPALDLVGDLGPGADQGHVLDQLGGHGGDGALLVAGQVEVLDLFGFGLVAHPDEDLVVEVDPAGAHAADVQGQRGPDLVGGALEVVVLDDRPSGRRPRRRSAPCAGRRGGRSLRPGRRRRSRSSRARRR